MRKLLVLFLAVAVLPVSAATHYFTDGSPFFTPSDPQTNETFTMGEAGISGAPTGTAEYQRYGNVVILSIPTMSGTSDGTAFMLTGLPTDIRPSAPRSVGAINLTNAGLRLMGSCVVNTDGTISLSAGVIGSLFSAILGKGIDRVDIAYLL